MMVSRLWVIAIAFLSFLGNMDASVTTPDTSTQQHQVRSRKENQETEIQDYRLLPAEEIHSILEEWKERYADFVKITTSQEKYGLPAAGDSPDDCPFYEGEGCPNHILEIQDYAVHPEDSESSKNLPSVFISGCLHGNERVGPTATMEAVSMLLEAALCESTLDTTCRLDLKKSKGIDDKYRKWLARLVTTRRIVVVPMSNSLGYFRNTREEGAIDPNRDFPYDLQDPTKCMQTIAGRTLNEIYRDNLFQLALTFHAGMEVVAYEWGSPTWLEHFSPDDIAQESIASAYSRYGGGWSRSKPYQYGTMNDMVYFVRGGMEDWAYAGSWDPERVVQCQPRTFGGYPAEKTIYNNSTLRVFNMLVETSDLKTPPKDSLGTSLDVLSRDTPENGHVSRNIRLALLAAELVEPYVSVVGVNELVLQDDLPPMQSRNITTCHRSKAFSIAKDASEVEIKFSVGGAMSIDDVDIWYAKWEDVSQKQLDCLSQPKTTEGFEKGTITSARTGSGFFSVAGSHPRPEDQNQFTSSTFRPVFTGKVPIPDGLKHLDQLAILVSARVDQNWKDGRPNIQPNIAPQSHIVNARTNPDWHHESAGKHIHGRLDWFSVPINIVIGDFEEGVGTHGGNELVRTVEMYPRRHSGSASTGGLRPKSAVNDQLWSPVSTFFILVLFLALMAVCLFSGMRWQRRSRRVKESLRGSYNQDEGFVFDSKPYSDVQDDEFVDDVVDDEDLNDGVELPSIQ